MEVIDDFLEIGDFNNLNRLLMGENVCWHFVPFTDGKDKNNDQFYFGDNVYMNHSWVSSLSNDLSPLIAGIKPMAIHTIRANLMTKSEKHIESQLHSDLEKNAPTIDKVDQWTTAIFYINDCNGYTKLEDGTIVESKANRLLTFSSDTKHLGATCTDEKRRVLINLNYFT